MMKVVLLGDSITEGIGKQLRNFQPELERLLGADWTVRNLAKTGSTSDCVGTQMDKIEEERPDFAVLLFGNVDAQIRPSRTGRIFRHLPGRFGAENGCMILPRPFYSHKWYLRWIQRMENAVRAFFRKLVYRVDGSEQWISLDQYRNNLIAACEMLRQRGAVPVICSTVCIDEELFPGSDHEYRKYNEEARRIAVDKKLPFVDLYDALRSAVGENGWENVFNADHFHPNQKGYEIIAAQIAAALKREL